MLKKIPPNKNKQTKNTTKNRIQGAEKTLPYGLQKRVNVPDCLFYILWNDSIWQAPKRNRQWFWSPARAQENAQQNWRVQSCLPLAGHWGGRGHVSLCSQQGSGSVSRGQVQEIPDAPWYCINGYPQVLGIYWLINQICELHDEKQKRYQEFKSFLR